MSRPVRTCLLFVSLFLILFAWSGSSAEASAGPRSLSDLVRNKTDIFTGEVVALESRWNEERTWIHTEILVRVSDSLVGSAEGEVLIEVLGGRVEDVQLDVVGAPEFSPGEKILVLTERGRDGKYRLPDLMIDKFTLLGRQDGRLDIRSEISLGGIVPVDLGKSETGHQMSWDAFRSFLDDAVRGAEISGWVADPEAESVAKGPDPDRGFHIVGPGSLHGSKSLCPNEASAFAHWDLRLTTSCGKFFEINPNLMTSTPNPGQPNLGNANIVAEISSAASAWTNVSPAHISLASANNASACPAPGLDNVNCVAWDPNFWPNNGISRAVYGVTCLWRNAMTGEITEADIVLNNQPDDEFNNPTTWRLTPPNLNDPVVCGQAPVGLRALVTHEFGHFVGLHHPNQASNPPGCNNDDPMEETMMFQFYKDACKINLHRADQDGINFLYSADHGDLDDPPYPTKVLGDDGASHVFGTYPRFQYEWLGICCGKIDDNPAECDALTAPIYDRYDDGGLLLAKCEGDKLEVDHVTFLVGVQTNSDVLGRSHPYDASRPMYVNAWFDWDDDGKFQASEHVIGAAPGSFMVTKPGIYGFRLNPPEGTPCLVSHRLRLDYLEDVGQMMKAVDPRLNLEKWAARHGEVEDYVGPYGDFNTHPNRPRGPEGKRLPVGSPFYCHIGGMTVTFDDGSSADVDGFCHPPEPWITGGGVPHPGTLFPDKAGKECMNSTLSFNLDINQDGKVDESLGLAGPVCVTRSAPYYDDTGLKVIDTEMISLEMSGHSQYAGEVTVRLADGFKSTGRIQQSELAAEMGVDVSIDAPAESYFDIHWVMKSSKFGSSEVLGPVRAESQIASVPPGPPIGQKPNEVPDQDEAPDQDGDLPGEGEVELPVVRADDNS